MNNESSNKKFDIKLNTKSEKLIMNICLSIAGAILFDQHKRKLKNPKKYNNFFKRVQKNYKIVDTAVSKTLAKDLSKKKEIFKCEVLNDLEIENAEIIDID